VKLKVPTIPAASVAFGFLAVKTFVPVLDAALLAPPAGTVLPEASVQVPFGAAVET